MKGPEPGAVLVGSGKQHGINIPPFEKASQKPGCHASGRAFLPELPPVDVSLPAREGIPEDGGFFYSGDVFVESLRHLVDGRSPPRKGTHLETEAATGAAFAFGGEEFAAFVEKHGKHLFRTDGGAEAAARAESLFGHLVHDIHRDHSFSDILRESAHQKPEEKRKDGKHADEPHRVKHADHDRICVYLIGDHAHLSQSAG